MAVVVCSGATMMCSFGAAPSTLNVLPIGRTNASKMPAATIMDNIPITNIAPFGVCMSLANPQVAAATSAALGVLTPQPCIPATMAPWTPGSPMVTIGNKPVLTNSSTLMCNWAGVITVSVPGQFTVMAT